MLALTQQLGSLLCLGVALFLLFFLAITMMRQGTRARFARLHHGRTYFIWASRRDWHDVVMNNILPALPPDVIAAHEHSPLGQSLRVARLIGLDWQTRQHSRPYLLAPRGRRLHARSCNDPLQDLKPRARRSAAVQDQARVILAEQLAALRETADPAAATHNP